MHGNQSSLGSPQSSLGNQGVAQNMQARITPAPTLTGRIFSLAAKIANDERGEQWVVLFLEMINSFDFDFEKLNSPEEAREWLKTGKAVSRLKEEG